MYIHVYACVISHSLMSDPLDPKTVVQQAALSMEFSREEYWNGLPFPTPGNIPDPGLNPQLLCFLHWQADFLPLPLLGSPVYKYTHTHTHTHTHTQSVHYTI